MGHRHTFIILVGHEQKKVEKPCSNHYAIAWALFRMPNKDSDQQRLYFDYHKFFENVLVCQDLTLSP